MRKPNLKNWKYNNNLEGLLFAAQRLDEALFFYTQDTYKANVLNTRTLIDEFLYVRNSIDEGLLKEKTDIAVIEEIMWSLGHDKEARHIIGEEIVENLKKNIGSLSTKEKVKYFSVLRSKLSGLGYFNTIKHALQNEVKTRNKKEIDRLILQFICEAKNQGYNSRYIYKCVNQIFFIEEVSSYDTIELFLKKFDCAPKKYLVYVEIDEEIGNICENFTHALKQIEVELLKEHDIPSEIRMSNEKGRVLKFQYVEALDDYSALEIAQDIIKTIGHFYAFYRHNIELRIKGGYTSAEGEKITYIRPEVTGIKKSAQISSLKKSTSSATAVFNIARSSHMNFYVLSRIMEIHNIAFGMDAPANSLLDLWSILELLLEKDNEANGKSRVLKIIDMLEPFIKGAYIEQIITSIKNDIKRWDKNKYSEILKEIDIEGDENTKIFAFVALDEFDNMRKDVFSCLDNFPLLRYRIHSLHEVFKHGKNVSKLLKEHEEKTSWHIQRIYRARNCIIHDGEQVQNIENLVENLHSYIDVLCNGIVRLLNNERREHRVIDAIYEMHIKEKMYEEYVKTSEPTKDNVQAFILS